MFEPAPMPDANIEAWGYGGWLSLQPINTTAFQPQRIALSNIEVVFINRRLLCLDCFGQRGEVSQDAVHDVMLWSLGAAKLAPLAVEAPSARCFLD